MTSSQKAHLINSTNGRSVPLTVRAVRAWFRVASVVAPRAVERQAANLFLAPPRKRRNDPPLEDPAEERHAMTVRDGEMRVAAWSWGTGPAVLLAHGWGGAAADMAPLAGELQRAGYRAILFDFPAHGRSAGRRTNMVEWLRTLRAVAAEVGALHALAGHSFGGAAVALAMAEHEMDVRGAVLMAPALGPVYFLEQFRGMTGLSAARAEGMMRHIARTIGREPASLDAREAAAALRVPALVVHDPADRDVPWAHGESIAQAWSGSRLLRAEGLGHRRLLRDPAILAAATEFIAGLGARETRLAAAS
jgi:pimeloyl-ACP methyl ester carboxylesterase